MLLKDNETKVDPRTRRTRQMLHAAFRDLMREQDFQSISVQKITERAGLNRATFYAHYVDKYALLAESVREDLQTLLEQQMPDMRAFTLGNLRLLIITAYEFMGRFSGKCAPGAAGDHAEQMLIGVQVQQHIYEMLKDWFEREQTGERRHAISTEHGALALSWTIFGTASQSMMVAHKPASREFADELLAFLRPALSEYLSPEVED